MGCGSSIPLPPDPAAPQPTPAKQDGSATAPPAAPLKQDGPEPLLLPAAASALASAASASGATLRLTGELEPIGDGFVLAARNPAAEAGRAGAADGKGGHPFLEPAEALRTPVFERSVGGAVFSVLLNKFPVLDEHMLLVRAQKGHFQTDALALADLEAAHSLLTSLGGLFFFNSGKASGASMPHKHLQLFPAPALATLRAAAGGQLACEAWLPGATERKGMARGEAFSLGALAGLDHACVLLAPTASAPVVYAAYGTAMRAAGLGGVFVAANGTDRMGDAAYQGHNVLLTSEWLMVVARTDSHAWRGEGGGKGLNVNSTGFVGVLMPDGGDAAVEARLRAPGGGMAALRAVCRPATAAVLAAPAEENTH